MSDLHPGPCEYDGGYGEGGAKVVCTLCLDAIRASKRVGIFDAFLRYAVDTCVNPGLLSLEVLPPGAAVCSRCGAEVRLEGFCAECEGSVPAVAANQYTSPKEPDQDFDDSDEEGLQ